MHRELYDWFLDQVYDDAKVRPKQREFARRNLSHTVVSKRKLAQLVEGGHVTGWDDPRMSTISGLRRRGYTPEAIRAPRVHGVLDPLKLVITNYPEGQEEWLNAENNPGDESAGSRTVPFSGVLYIERADFREEANKKFFRLKLGKEVRLKNGYIIKAESCTKDADGTITEVQCTYDPKSKSGSGTEESLRKVKGTLHWVSIKHALAVEVRLYDRLFTEESPDTHKDKDFMEFVNPDSLEIKTAYVEPHLKNAQVGDKVQFQRIGYFCVDPDSTTEKLVFNRTVGLRDSWAKIQQKG